MSYVPIGAGIAAAAARQRRIKEEEAMAKYNSDDLDGWEFKIVRSNWPKFHKTEEIEKIRQEEAQNGWELLEKFDNYRLRFKRLIEKRSMDIHSQSDPYRSQVGSANKTKLLIIAGISLLIFGLTAYFITSSGNSELTGSSDGKGIIAVVVGIAITTAIVAIVKRR